jgi:hypothetical protein
VFNGQKNSVEDPDPHVFGPLGSKNPLVRGTDPDSDPKKTDDNVPTGKFIFLHP